MHFMLKKTLKNSKKSYTKLIRKNINVKALLKGVFVLLVLN